MGELIKNIHTFVVPNGNAYTLETDWEYDSWNRMKNILYPDGEMVAYHYDNGGKLVSMDGVKGSQNFNYVGDVKYNMYGSRTRIDYGNSTYALYTYNPLNQRLTTLKSYDANDSLMQNINYGYDAASNITSIENVAGSLNNGLGGICLNYFTYDDLYRLTNSYGAFASANNGPLYQSLDMTYSASGNILSKEVSAQKEIGGAVQNVNYSNTYAYGGRPHTVTSAGSNDYEWDENGNMIMRSDGNDTRRLCWDEENRLTTVRDDGEQGVLSSYIYNAGGERTWKLAGDAYAMYINGQYQYGGAMLMKTLYSSPYMVLTDEEYSKHYFIEGERVCSKIGGGFALAAITPSSTQNFLVNDETQVATDLWTMVKRGVECSGFPVENIDIKKELPSAENLNDDAEINQYFYHSDHLGSSSFITDATGNATQHLQYLSFGETWIDQQSGSFDSRYKFSAKEKDDETQYSYFGARYYDSDLSVFLSIDRFADKYPNLSPFNYAANNPIRIIDINGDSLGLENGRMDGGDSRGDFTNYLAEKTGWNLVLNGDKVDFASPKDYKKARKDVDKSHNTFKSILFSSITSDDKKSLMIGSNDNTIDVSKANFIDYSDLQYANGTGFDLARIGASLTFIQDPSIYFKNGAGVKELSILMEENNVFKTQMFKEKFETRRKWGYDNDNTIDKNQHPYDYIWIGANESIFTVTCTHDSNTGSLTKIDFNLKTK